MSNKAPTIINGEPVKLIGTAGDSEMVYYGLSLNQVYLVDTLMETTKTLTHEEFIDICNMRGAIEALAQETPA